MVDNSCEDVENLIVFNYLSKEYSKFIAIVNIDLETKSSLNEEEHFDFGNFFIKYIRNFMKENNYIRLISKGFKKSYENHKMWETYFNKKMQWSLYGEENHFFTLILNGIKRDNESEKMIGKAILFSPKSKNTNSCPGCVVM
jgi:hypothetical protein